MSAPSKGPWKVFLVQDGPNKGELLGVGKMNGTGVTDAYGGLWGSGGEKLANAYLVAAAPELLQAVIESRSVLRTVHGETTDPTALRVLATKIAKLDAVIAKANGEVAA